MLDTDSVSYALRGEGGVGERIVAHRPSALCVSAITVAELRYGADKRRSKRLHRLIDDFIGALTVVAFDEAAATAFGIVASSLEHRGAPIGAFDAMIAAHAVQQRLTLVTRNVRHFARVPGARVENWFVAN